MSNNLKDRYEQCVRREGTYFEYKLYRRIIQLSEYICNFSYLCFAAYCILAILMKLARIISKQWRRGSQVVSFFIMVLDHWLPPSLWSKKSSDNNTLLRMILSSFTCYLCVVQRMWPVRWADLSPREFLHCPCLPYMPAVFKRGTHTTGRMCLNFMGRENCFKRKIGRKKLKETRRKWKYLFEKIIFTS